MTNHPGAPTSYLPPPPLPPHPPAGPGPSRARRRIALAAAGTLLTGASLAGGIALGLATQPEQVAAEGATETPWVIAEPPAATDDDSTGRGPGSAYGGTRLGQEWTGDTTQATDATDAQSTGIVQISTTVTGGTAAGTGIVLDEDGTIVTNHHVVEDATSIEVTVVTTGQTYEARYVGGDTATDVAVLELEDADALTTAPVADTDVAVGDEITAVGDAGGDGGPLTASSGTVTAEGQDITVQNDDGSTTSLTDLIQVRAYVVPGDSGGALLDADGEVIGMNVAASSNARDVTGYAIPFATVLDVAEQVLSGVESGTVSLGYHGYLGVGLSTTATAPEVVQVMDGEAAADAGIAVGDTITGVDGASVATADDLQAAIAATEPGDRVVVEWTTADGERRSASITLGEAPVS